MGAAEAIALAGLFAKLAAIGVEQVTASAERRAELRAEADAEYAKCIEILMSVDRGVASNNADADKAAQAIDTLNKMHAIAAGAGAKVDE